MVVMVVLALLAAIVSGGVLGTKGKGEDAQVKADAFQAQQAVSRFNNDSAAGDWPDASTNKVAEVDTDHPPDGADEVQYQGITMYESDGTTPLDPAKVEYTTLDWDATTQVRDSSGDLVTRKLVPDWLTHKPTNSEWQQTVSGVQKDVYAWVMLKGTALNGEETRTVQVFKLDAAGDKYIQLTP
jgi:type II secretory pathway pseudopilin PulG